MKRKKIIIAAICAAAVIGAGILAVIVSKGRPVSEEKQRQLTNDLSRPFQATANIKLDEIILTADLNKTAANQLTMQITEPPTLKDLSFSYNGTDITVSYKGMSAVINDDSILAKALAGIVMRSINSATENTGLHVAEQDGVLVVEGKSPDGTFILQLDKQNGSILNLSVPQLDLECEFPQFFFSDTSQQTE